MKPASSPKAESSGSAEKPPFPKGRAVVAEGTPGEFTDHKDDIFFAAIETTRMPMLVTDPRLPDNPIVFANRAFIGMTGYTQDEVVGANCRFLQGPGTDPNTVALVREAVADEREISVEILNYRKDGSTFWNALFISPVYNTGGELVYFFASQLDVSRRRDAEDGLAQAQKMEALGQLTGGISHDFNNLLQVMSGHLDLLSARAEAGEVSRTDLDRGVESIRSAVAKASTLTQQLLAFSRKQSLRGRIVNLNTVARGMTQLAERTLGETVDVRYDLTPGLPNCELDPTQLEVAILNILVNARDAMPEGGTIMVRTGTAEVLDEDWKAHPGLRPGQYVTLTIADTGTGIPAQVLDRVMDPFFTTKDDGKGTGLGLSMVYGFAKQSRGTATIESEVGAGTRVRLYFPTVQASDFRADRVRPATDERGGSESILIVDDREDVVELAREMLQSLGYRVHVATSAKEALAVASGLSPEDRPALLFSDVVMPGGMNGYALAREMRARLPGIAVLLTTGFDRDMGRLDRGDVEFEVLKKPYRLADLARRVRLLLDAANEPDAGAGAADRSTDSGTPSDGGMPSEGGTPSEGGI